MEEPEVIVDYIDQYFDLLDGMKDGNKEGMKDCIKGKDLMGKRILITAGPTYEKIDPVRFIGNYSSGKMGFALAEECRQRGADVTLVAGPVSLSCHEDIHRIDVESCEEMYQATTKTFEVKARPVGKLDGLRPGMTLVMK